MGSFFSHYVKKHILTDVRYESIKPRKTVSTLQRLRGPGCTPEFFARASRVFRIAGLYDHAIDE